MKVELKTVGTRNEDGYTSETRNIMVNAEKVGFVNLMIDEEYTYCECIAICEEHRNKGIGTQVLEELSSEFCGIVVAPDNEDARRLYERLGREWVHEDAGYIDQGFGVYEI